VSAVARALTAAAGCCVALAACGGGGARTRSSVQASQRAALETYLHQIEPLRLAVNRLLRGADPILNAFADHRINHMVAARRMAVLERRFAEYSVEIQAIDPATAQLRTLHRVYAHTYVFEDSYLNALVSGLHEGDPDHLPDTQDEQRAAIIQWRFGLIVLARKLGVKLPADLQQAGRGEIAPSPNGS
jgi:hypothetical protein